MDLIDKGGRIRTVPMAILGESFPRPVSSGVGIARRKTAAPDPQERRHLGPEDNAESYLVHGQALREANREKLTKYQTAKLLAQMFPELG